MQIRVSNEEDRVEISGYVNAVERRSRPLKSRIGEFVERIRTGAFKRAISRNDNIRLLLNHDWSRDLGGTKDGNLKLREDSIGLHADAVVTDPEVVKKARAGELVGWSFGFNDVPNGVERSVEDGLPTRNVKDLELFEVSILDRSRTPAYDGTLLSVRSDESVQYYGEPMIYEDGEIRSDEPLQAEKPAEIDYGTYEQWIKEMTEETK